MTVMTAVQDANANGAYIQFSMEAVEGIETATLFDELAEAINEVVKRYERELGKDIDYTGYVFDAEHNAIY